MMKRDYRACELLYAYVLLLFQAFLLSFQQLYTLSTTQAHDD